MEPPLSGPATPANPTPAVEPALEPPPEPVQSPPQAPMNMSYLMSSNTIIRPDIEGFADRGQNQVKESHENAVGFINRHQPNVTAPDFDSIVDNRHKQAELERQEYDAFVIHKQNQAKVTRQEYAAFVEQKKNQTKETSEDIDAFVDLDHKQAALERFINKKKQAKESSKQYDAYVERRKNEVNDSFIDLNHKQANLERRKLDAFVIRKQNQSERTRQNYAAFVDRKKNQGEETTENVDPFVDGDHKQEALERVDNQQRQAKDDTFVDYKKNQAKETGRNAAAYVDHNQPNITTPAVDPLVEARQAELESQEHDAFVICKKAKETSEEFDALVDHNKPSITPPDVGSFVDAVKNEAIENRENAGAFVDQNQLSITTPDLDSSDLVDCKYKHIELERQEYNAFVSKKHQADETDVFVDHNQPHITDPDLDEFGLPKLSLKANSSTEQGPSSPPPIVPLQDIDSFGLPKLPQINSAKSLSEQSSPSFFQRFTAKFTNSPEPTKNERLSNSTQANATQNEAIQADTTKDTTAQANAAQAYAIQANTTPADSNQANTTQSTFSDINIGHSSSTKANLNGLSDTTQGNTTQSSTLNTRYRISGSSHANSTQDSIQTNSYQSSLNSRDVGLLSSPLKVNSSQSQSILGSSGTGLSNSTYSRTVGLSDSNQANTPQSTLSVRSVGLPSSGQTNVPESTVSGRDVELYGSNQANVSQTMISGRTVELSSSKQANKSQSIISSTIVGLSGSNQVNVSQSSISGKDKQIELEDQEYNAFVSKKHQAEETDVFVDHNQPHITDPDLDELGLPKLSLKANSSTEQGPSSPPPIVPPQDIDSFGLPKLPQTNSAESLSELSSPSFFQRIKTKFTNSPEPILLTKNDRLSNSTQSNAFQNEAIQVDATKDTTAQTNAAQANAIQADTTQADSHQANTTKDNTARANVSQSTINGKNVGISGSNQANNSQSTSTIRGVTVGLSGSDQANNSQSTSKNSGGTLRLSDSNQASASHFMVSGRTEELLGSQSQIPTSTDQGPPPPTLAPTNGPRLTDTSTPSEDTQRTTLDAAGAGVSKDTLDGHPSDPTPSPTCVTGIYPCIKCCKSQSNSRPPSANPAAPTTTVPGTSTKDDISSPTCLERLACCIDPPHTPASPNPDQACVEDKQSIQRIQSPKQAPINMNYLVPESAQSTFQDNVELANRSQKKSTLEDQSTLHSQNIRSPKSPEIPSESGRGPPPPPPAAPRAFDGDITSSPTCLERLTCCVDLPHTPASPYHTPAYSASSNPNLVGTQGKSKTSSNPDITPAADTSSGYIPNITCCVNPPHSEAGDKPPTPSCVDKLMCCADPPITTPAVIQSPEQAPVNMHFLLPTRILSPITPSPEPQSTTPEEPTAGPLTPQTETTDSPVFPLTKDNNKKKKKNKLFTKTKFSPKNQSSNSENKHTTQFSNLSKKQRALAQSSKPRSPSPFAFLQTSSNKMPSPVVPEPGPLPSPPPGNTHQHLKEQSCWNCTSPTQTVSSHSSHCPSDTASCTAPKEVLYKFSTSC